MEIGRLSIYLSPSRWITAETKSLMLIFLLESSSSKLAKMLGAAVFFPSANNPQSLIARKSPSFTYLNHKNSKAFFNVRASFTDFPLASRLIVRNLSHSTNEINLKKEFSNFGEVAEVKLVKDESGKRSKGYAFIQYTSQDDAMLALENLDCRYIDGRTVFLELAKPSRKKCGRYPITSGPPPPMMLQGSS